MTGTAVGGQTGPSTATVFLVDAKLTEAGLQTIAKLQGYFVAEGNDYETALDFAWHEIRSDSSLAREAYGELVDPEPPPKPSKAARRWLARTNRWVASVNASATRRRRVLSVVAFRPREAGRPRRRLVRARLRRARSLGRPSDDPEPPLARRRA
jgi:hypothetical protein